MLCMLARFKIPNMAVERNARNFCECKMLFGKVLFAKLLIYYFAHLNILSVPQEFYSHTYTGSHTYTPIYEHIHTYKHTHTYRSLLIRQLNLLGH